MSLNKKSVEIHTLNYRNDLQEEYKLYHEWLNEAMRKESLHNIALMGVRGSGKSSIIHSYDKRQHRGDDEKFLYISLAEFAGGCVVGSEEEKKQDNNEADTGEKGDKEKKEEGGETKSNPVEEGFKWKNPPSKKKLTGKEREQLLKRLEYNLLCQILARCTKENLRGSTMEHIPEIRESRRFVPGKYVYLFSGMFLLFALIFRDVFAPLVKWVLGMMEKPLSALLNFLGVGLDEAYLSYIPAIGYSLAFCAVFAVLAYFFSRKPGAFRIGKVNLKATKVEAELAPSANEFCLDRYKFELVHILNQISEKIDCVVVIEDLELIEEYQCMEIMSRLRELNLLVNTHRREQYRRGRDHSLIGWVEKALEYGKNAFLSWMDPEHDDEQTLYQGKISGQKKENSENKKRLIRRKFDKWRKKRADQIREREQKRDCWPRWPRWRKWKRPIRFVYTLSDATFGADERVKFFDTIIPVTPALNAKNAKEILKNAFTGRAGMETDEGDALITAMQMAVTDYRMVADIATEYIFYSELYEENNKRKEKQVEEEKSKEKREDEKPQTAEQIETDMTFADLAKKRGATDQHAEDTKGKKLKIKREQRLLALAAYKALLPVEFHFAFTTEGGGMLLNPAVDRIEGRAYNQRAVEFVEFMFQNGYLGPESLTMVGYSPEALKRQWVEILTSGDKEKIEDLAGRFSVVNIGRETEASIYAEAMEEAYNKGADNEAFLKQYGRSYFGTAESAARMAYAALESWATNPKEFLRMIVCLSAFDAAELKNAVENMCRNKNQEKEIKDFQKRLRQKISMHSIPNQIRNDQNYKKTLLGVDEESSEYLKIVGVMLGKNELETKNVLTGTKTTDADKGERQKVSAGSK